MNECPYMEECATVQYWFEIKADFIRLVCNTEEHLKCVHYFGSLKPQHDEREKSYGDPHYGEPNWKEVFQRHDLGTCVVCGEKAVCLWPLLPGSPGFCSKHHREAEEYGADLTPSSMN